MHRPSTISQAGQVLRAGCKVNLYLHILDKRPDGLHNLESVFLPLPKPSDSIEVRPAEAGQGLSLTSSIPELAGQENTVAVAWRLFGEQTGFWPDLQIHVEKGIPVGAGLGGGSSDAAALLTFLAKLAPPEACPDEDGMFELARKIGSDVPFFLMNRPAWVEGAGERLRPLDVDLPDCRLLIICPRMSVSTREAYRALDASRASGRDHPGEAALTTATNIFTGGLRFSGRLFVNSFEKVIFEIYPALGAMKRTMLKLGASGAVLSGSGAALVAAFARTADTGRVTDFLQECDVSWYEISLSDWGVAKR